MSGARFLPLFDVRLISVGQQMRPAQSCEEAPNPLIRRILLLIFKPRGIASRICKQGFSVPREILFWFRFKRVPGIKLNRIIESFELGRARYASRTDAYARVITASDDQQTGRRRSCRTYCIELQRTVYRARAVIIISETGIGDCGLIMNERRTLLTSKSCRAGDGRPERRGFIKTPGGRRLARVPGAATLGWAAAASIRGEERADVDPFRPGSAIIRPGANERRLSLLIGACFCSASPVVREKSVLALITPSLVSRPTSDPDPDLIISRLNKQSNKQFHLNCVLLE